MDFPELISQVVEAPEPGDRVAALHALVEACQRSAAAPFEEILDVLDERGSPIAVHADPNPNVRRALRGMVGDVCEAQRLQIGLRVARPEDERELWWFVIRPLYFTADIYQGRRELDAVLDDATRGQRALHAIHWSTSEICNGGFRQYFFNSTGIVWPYAKAGYRLLGLGPLAALFERAGAPFTLGKPPSDFDQRRAEVEALDESLFEPLNEEFFSLRKSLEVADTVEKYIRDNPGEFFR